MRLTAALVSGAVLALARASPAPADGLLPSQPYHYLHPAPAVARGNHQPSSVDRSFALKKGALATDFILFTHDSQAGMGANSGQLSAPKPSTSIRLTIRPVDPPGHFPSGLLLDGNAYNFSLLGEPGNRPVTVRHSLSLALRWPHGPSAVLIYRSGSWHSVCTPYHWQISPPNIVVCQIRELGTYAVARRAIH